MNIEMFLRYSFDPVIIGFYACCAYNPTEEIEINTENLEEKIRYIKETYPNSFIDNFWSGEEEIIAHAIY